MCKIWDIFEKSKSYKSKKQNSANDLLEMFDAIIDEVSINIEGFHFNKSVAKIYEYVNLLSSLMKEKQIHREELSKIIKNLTIIIHPFIPHISEEIWNKIKVGGLCAMAKWPNIKKSFGASSIKMPVQINGKIRSLININMGEKKEFVIKKVMADPKIKKNVLNKEILKTIYVENKIVNLVVK